MTNVEVDWTRPGPGTWELDTAHFDPTVSRPVRDVMTEAVEIGLGEGLELGGAPVKTMHAAFVNGHLYFRLEPLVGGDSDRPPPPKAVLWFVTRLHPTFRKRAKRSVAAMDERYWMLEAERWEQEWKPRLIETNRRFGAVDVRSLTDAELASHLGALWNHLRWSTALHFRLHASDLAPIGRLLVAAEDWGLDERDVMATLAGSSPATSAPARAIAQIAAELAACGVVPTSLGDVRAASSRAADLLDEYLTEFGNRITTGYDIRNRTLVELPDVVVSSIRNASAKPSDVEAVGREAFDRLTEQLDPADRGEFAELVSEARTLYGLRDENGPLTSEWPSGVMRHAVIEAGRRLVDRDAIGEFEHVFDAAIGELRALLVGAADPSATDLAERCNERMGWSAMTAPAVLGPVSELPDFDVLPGRMPEMMRAIVTVRAMLERDDVAGEQVADRLKGTGVGQASYRGTARVVADADEAFARAEPGDIIVTRLTVPTFNSVLAMAGGVVTQGGGLLSHTAVIARELGIPAVIGVVGALTDIPDGAEIELDPILGTVTVL